MIGYMMNNLTPRGGELARPFILSRRENVRFYCDCNNTC